MKQAAPLVVFLLALVPRLACLGCRPFWLDEVVTAQRAAMPLPALIRSAFEAHHTPLYFLLLAPFAHMADAQLILRLPSAILGAADVMLVYLIAARIGGAMAGLAAALIVGLSPSQIAFSQDARSYMLMICFLLLAMHGLAGLALNPLRAALPWRQGGAGREWLHFIAGTILAFCTLGDSLPWLMAADITAAAMIWRAVNRRLMLRNFLAANAIILACTLPVYGLMLYLGGNPAQGLALVPPPTPRLIFYDLATVYLMRVGDFMSAHFMSVSTPMAFSFGIGLGLIFAVLAGLRRLRGNPLPATLLLSAVLILPVFYGIVSIRQPVLIPRYLLWGALPFAILAGLGFCALLDRMPAGRIAALAAGALLLVVNLVPFYEVETKPRWDIAAQFLAAQSRPGDIAYLSQSSANWTLHYYLPAKLQPVLLTDWDGDLRHVQQQRAAGRRVWAIYGEARFAKDGENAAAFLATLRPLGRPDAVFQAGSRITIWRYDPG